MFGGVFDAEFAEHSRGFFRRVEKSEVIVLLGETTEQELKGAPERVRGVLDGLSAEACLRCPTTPAIAELAAAYLRAGVLGPRWKGDATQVATATVHRADVLVSWNFKHIVRFDKVRAFNAVNGGLGYGPVYICSPAEVRYGGEVEDL
ncbi:MAG: PIN domain protein [Planctomycetota bacterium]